MMYFYLFLLPTLAGLIIIYVYSYNKHFYRKDDNLPKNSFYSAQEILSSSQNYIPLHLSINLPDYSKYRVKGKTEEGIRYFFKIFKGDFLENTRFLLLGSAGIGKTTFLINLYKEASQYLSESTNIQLVPLRTCDLEIEIQSLNHPEQTILLLDGLDELPIDSTLSLDKIIKITGKFKYVIIASRLEFFKENNLELTTNTLKYSGDKEYYKIQKVYLSPFSKKEIRKYLKTTLKDAEKIHQFFNIIFGNPLVYKAEVLLNRVKFASLKPLFLCYITDIIKENEEISYSISDSEMFECLIHRWILRESYNVEDKGIFIESMDEILAKITLSMKSLGRKYLLENEIENISLEYKSNLHNISIKSKSLLVRNGQGHFYFFHSSISEYLLAKNKIQEEIKKNNLFENIKIDIHCNLYTHFINEMGVNYLLETNRIKANLANKINNDLLCFSFTKEDIDSWKNLIEIKYFYLVSCDLSLDLIFPLFPNIQRFEYKDMKEEDLKYLIHFKKLEILDISENGKIKSLSSLKHIPTLKKLILTKSNVDLSTLTLNSIKEIIISKGHYTELELHKLFPLCEIKNKIDDSLKRITIIKLHKTLKDAKS